MSNCREFVPVSVIIPAYNGEMYVGETVDAILKQTVLPEEVILVDDGSTDGTLRYLKSRYGDNRIVKIISKSNGGAGDAKNFGINASRSSYLFFCDSDDILDPEFFGVFKAALEENDKLDLFCFGAEVFHGNGKRDVRVLQPVSGWVGFGHQAMYDLINNKTYTAASWAYIVRNDIVTKNSLRFLGRIHEDHNFSAKVYLNSKVTYRTSRVLYSQRARLGSLTRMDTISNESISDRIAAFYSVLDLFMSFPKNEAVDMPKLIDAYIVYSYKALVELCVPTRWILPSSVLFFFNKFNSVKVINAKDFLMTRFPFLFFLIKKVVFIVKRRLLV
ncbi:glycosyltransferase family 2 protein [Methylococcaceae bacterium WWC4]|nr:glycosyltransferase family 2 protein [Methylococcaceae bacterium WWC4]